MDNHSAPRKRGLGRGLGALIRNTEAYNPNDMTAPSGSRGIQQLRVEQIQPNPRQPRVQFDEVALAELADSIRIHGIIQPLIVTHNPDRPESYFLIAGERRWRAAQLAAIDTLPALVREASPSQLLEWALIENLQRTDLNPLEEAGAYRTLMEEFGMTQDEVAERVGKSRPAVGNAVRLLDLPLAYQEALMNGQISAGHARALLRLKDQPALMERTFDTVTLQELNVRQTEALVGQLVATPAAPAPQASEPSPVQLQITQLENRFRSVLGTRVNLNRNDNGSGRLVIHFYSDDDLAQLYTLITGGHEPG